MSMFFILLGGGVGALARYGLSLLLPYTAGGFPWSTFTVNLVGAFLMGILAGCLAGQESMRLFWVIGVLGSFTTFSAFSLETLYLLQQRDILTAMCYIVGSIFLGLIACWFGLRIAGYA